MKKRLLTLVLWGTKCQQLDNAGEPCGPKAIELFGSRREMVPQPLPSVLPALQSSLMGHQHVWQGPTFSTVIGIYHNIPNPNPSPPVYYSGQIQWFTHNLLKYRKIPISQPACCINNLLHWIDGSMTSLRCWLSLSQITNLKQKLT